MKTAYKYNQQGAYVGAVMLHESPREPGVYPMPPNATLQQPESKSDIFIDGAWVPQLSAITPESKAKEKTDEVVSDFVAATSGPFIVNDMSFDHGMTSILKIFLAIEKSKKNGETTRIIYEQDETPHEMTLEEAEQVAVAIGNDYDKKDALMRAYKKQISSILANTDTDEEKVLAIDTISISYEV